MKPLKYTHCFHFGHTPAHASIFKQLCLPTLLTEIKRIITMLYISNTWSRINVFSVHWNAWRERQKIVSSLASRLLLNTRWNVKGVLNHGPLYSSLLMNFTMKSTMREILSAASYKIFIHCKTVWNSRFLTGTLWTRFRHSTAWLHKTLYFI